MEGAPETAGFTGQDQFNFVGRADERDEGIREKEKEAAGPARAAKLGPTVAAAGEPGFSDDGNNKQMPPVSVMTRLILIMVWRKLIRNPNTYSSLIGLTWSLIAFRSAHTELLFDYVFATVSLSSHDNHLIHIANLLIHHASWY